MNTKNTVIIRHEPPPIPDRNFDWHATRDGYEPGDPVGSGRNETEALWDLLDKELAALAMKDKQERK